MVKRRKTSATSGGKTTVEIKEERSPAAADDVSLARDRLRGVLQRQGRRDLGDESSDSGHDDNRTPAETPSQPPTKKQTSVQRKRRRMDLSQEVAFHHTYVMKLFDRSVDLAQFREDTPLYPICRAWMANQPCSVFKEISSQLDLKVEHDTDEEKLNERNDSADEAYPSSDPDSDLVRPTYKMPLPTPHDDTVERYPNTEPPPINGLKDLNFDDPQPPSKETLLQEHMQRWSNVRSEWIASCLRNEDRYAASGRILTAIYKRAQKAFENS